MLRKFSVLIVAFVAVVFTNSEARLIPFEPLFIPAHGKTCMVRPGRGPSKSFGLSCKFPFTYSGKTYDTCAFKEDHQNDDTYAWCSTEVDSNGKHVRNLGKWGFCDPHTCPLPEKTTPTDVEPCSQPSAVTGSCRAAIPVWSFNKTSGTCNPFTYGGCGGNANQFESKDICEKECVKDSDSRKCDPVPHIQGGSYTYCHDDYDYDYYDLSVDGEIRSRVCYAQCDDGFIYNSTHVMSSIWCCVGPDCTTNEGKWTDGNGKPVKQDVGPNSLCIKQKSAEEEHVPNKNDSNSKECDPVPHIQGGSYTDCYDDYAIHGDNQTYDRKCYAQCDDGFILNPAQVRKQIWCCVGPDCWGNEGKWTGEYGKPVRQNNVQDYLCIKQRKSSEEEHVTNKNGRK